MNACIFHEGTLPSDISLDYEPAIFNLPAFNALQGSSPWISFYILNQNRKKAIAGIHFQIENQVARSPLKAPFGSVEFSKQILPRRLYEFLEYIELRLKQQGIAEIFIKNPPHGYESGKLSLLETFLLSQKYAVYDPEVSTLIQVGDEPFTNIIRHSEKLRLYQAQKADFVFKCLPIDNLDEVYHFLSRCHADKGYQVSMTLAELKRTVSEFPERYLLFVIIQEKKLIAASISIRIYQNTLYNFFANHEREYNQLSPLILLIEGMYTYCRENKITLLDLGTASRHGKPNFTLLDFKIHIGGTPSSKLAFYKKIG